MNSFLESKHATASADIPPRLECVSIFHPVVVISLIVAAMVIGALLFFFDPSRYPIYPFCTFNRITGLLCPGCGSLRALHCLLHGQVVAALHFNALLVVTLPLLGSYGLHLLLNQRQRRGGATIHTAWLWSGLVILILFGVLRNLSFAHSAWLAP